ncbi:MAG: hypothetical protein IKW35_07625 [Paludibacteraceae bacterium]|nr:hypothetical protein [Paludibacteraceae bacterium]
MLEKKAFIYQYGPNVLDVVRDDFAAEKMSGRRFRTVRRKGGKCATYGKLYHLRMVKRVRLEDYIV